MSSATEGRVYAFVAEDHAVKRSKLTPITTLSYDLGLECDDAIEFFDNFEIEFSVDLKSLGKDWDSYFSKENTLGVVAIPGVVAGFLLSNSFQRCTTGCLFSLALSQGPLLFSACCGSSARSTSRKSPFKT